MSQQTEVVMPLQKVDQEMVVNAKVILYNQENTWPEDREYSVMVQDTSIRDILKAHEDVLVKQIIIR